MSTFDENDKNLEALVIRNNGQARLTYEVARQLADHLPLQSFEELSKRVREITIGGQSTPVEALGQFVSRELFPIESLSDLAVKITGAIRLALVTARNAGQITTGAAREILASAGDGDAGLGVRIPAGYFEGPSIFGSKREGA